VGKWHLAEFALIKDKVMKVRELVGEIEKNIVQFGWFVLSTPLLFLILFGHYLSRANLFLCKVYLDILKEIKYEDMG
jgi:hypothetical protein